MSDLTRRIDDLAEFMREFNLAEGELQGEGWRVAFRKTRPTSVVEPSDGVVAEEFAEDPPVSAAAPVVETPVGLPVSSPMTGIFYASPSPTAPPFVKEGDTVEAGQVVALIEAMKVFNEITAPMAGRVNRIVAANGQLVQPGEPLLYIG
ncbi:MAG: acetyl-CoA carboxylase biotin carboxyl carrier protein subunit [Fimbriimonadaceae bacterium]